MRKNTYQKNKVILGFSGGVDSTVAALLLKDQGYNVIGYHFCVSKDNIEEFDRAKKVAKELDIELIHEDVSQEFEKIVIKNFCDEYQKGRTPNPCIICNPNIKFKKLLDTANELNAEYIATGHYAQIKESDNVYYITRSLNNSKDQTYMLYRLGQQFLSRLIFPLGKFQTKHEIREIAKSNSLSNFKQKDSQEICFVPNEKKYSDILKEKGVKTVPGNFVDSDGKILGRHNGISNYTIGQRKGLGIALGKPVFVTNINFANNTVTLGKNEDLMSSTVTIDNLFFTETQSSQCPEKYLSKALLGKSRYNCTFSDCQIIKNNEQEIVVEFNTPQRSFTPGQSLVLYDQDKVIGGGFIK